MKTNKAHTEQLKQLLTVVAIIVAYKNRKTLASKLNRVIYVSFWLLGRLLSAVTFRDVTKGNSGIR